MNQLSATDLDFYYMEVNQISSPEPKFQQYAKSYSSKYLAMLYLSSKISLLLANQKTDTHYLSHPLPEISANY